MEKYAGFGYYNAAMLRAVPDLVPVYTSSDLLPFTFPKVERVKRDAAAMENRVFGLVISIFYRNWPSIVESLKT